MKGTLSVDAADRPRESDTGPQSPPPPRLHMDDRSIETLLTPENVRLCYIFVRFPLLCCRLPGTHCVKIVKEVNACS